ncbi:MAG TPA: hypothetical protein VF516_06150 [Kofleriaceae bacterium]
MPDSSDIEALTPRQKRELLARLLNSKPAPEYPDLNLAPPSNLTFKVAETRQELESAFRILHDAYVSMGFMRPSPSGMRITIFNALPGTHTMIALWDGEAIGTMSIIQDSPMGFPIERVYRIDRLRAENVPLGEISAFAVKKTYRGDWNMILFPLIKFAYEYCSRHLGIERILMLTHPKRSEFHERILFCRRISAQVIDECEYVNGAPAVGFYLDIREFLEMCHARHGKEVSAHVATSLTNFVFPARTEVPSPPSMDPEAIDYFFNQKTDLLSKLSDGDRGILMSLYKDDRYRDILSRAQDKQKHSRQGQDER